MKKQIPLFGQFELETNGGCHRKCPTCLRNSDPDRERVQSWFADKFMPTEVVLDLFEQLKDLGWVGLANLQHYNEPLLDYRIEEFSRCIKQIHPHINTAICTTGDQITAERAKTLDGAFDRLSIALYMDEDRKEARQAELKALIPNSNIQWVPSDHTITHFSPFKHLEAAIKQNIDNPCYLPWWRMIINHRGDMLLCCDDMVGHYDLGNIADHTLEELWYSDKHQQIMFDLVEKGGRRKYSHCSNCPRGVGDITPAGKKWLEEQGSNAESQ